MSDCALIVGGGIAGLMTARGLSAHYQRVVVLDADQYPTGGVDRKGVPQGPHQHVLVAQGRKLLEDQCPGLDAELAAAGCELVDWGSQCLVVSSAGQVPAFDSELVTRPCTRAFLESRIRARVAALPNVEFKEDTFVEGLLVEAGKTAGVVLRGGAVLRGELVVDATGRHSRAPEWLEAAGFRRPEESVVNAFLGYASRFYKRPANAPKEWKAVLISTKPPSNPRAAGLWPVENDRWALTLAGTARCYPPTDEAGFLDFAKQLISPVIADAIADAEPLSMIRGFRNTENRWRHFERLDRVPERFVVIGDGVCAFNPIYAQGMTLALMQALTLTRWVERARAQGRVPGDGDFGLSFHRELTKVIRPGWLVATGEDCRWSSTEGPRGGLMQRASHWYLDRLMELTSQRPDLVNAFFSVTHLLRPPSSLFHPSLAGPILAHALNPFSRR